MLYHVPFQYRKPHYSTKLWRAWRLYINIHYSSEMFLEICQKLDVPLDYLVQDDNWVSDTFLSDFLTILKAKTQDPYISEKMGNFAVHPDALNPIEYALLSTVLFPALFYLRVPTEYRKLNRKFRFRLKQWKPGNFSYLLTPRGTFPDPEVCNNSLGFLQGTGRLFGLDKIEVKQTRCIHRGDKNCEFNVSYSARTFWFQKLKSLAGLLSVAATSVFFYLKTPESIATSKTSHALIISSAYILLILLFLISVKYFKLLKYIKQYNFQSQSKASELYKNYKKLDRRHNESNLLRALAEKLVAAPHASDVMKLCLDDLHDKFGYTRSMVMLLDAEKKRLYTENVRGFETGGENIFKLNLKYPAEKTNPEVFANILESGKSAFIADISKFVETLKPENRLLVEQLGVNSIVVVPIQDEKNKFGLLIVGSLGKENRLSQDDRFMIESVSKLLSISFQQMSTFDRERTMRKLFQKYVPAVVLDSLSTNENQLRPTATEVTALFVDLREFTANCERLPPEQVIAMLNRYAEFISTRIAKYGAVIDKLAGDGINAFFLPTENAEHHARRAVRSALLILEDLPELNREFESKGYGKAALGIGLHSGKATVGSMGCDLKLDYTAVGGTVNIASRLQDLSKRYRIENSTSDGTVVMSSVTRELADLDLPARIEKGVAIRGIKLPIDVWVISGGQGEISSANDEKISA